MVIILEMKKTRVTNMSSSSSSSLLFLLLLIQTLCYISQATVPDSQTFKFVNVGESGGNPTEYSADYREINISTSPFQLCFYNTTPNAYTLALRMGRIRSGLMRWVWEANRGKPVRDNATLSFETEGNLVLANADGRIAWQTGTANKGVVGLKILPNGNLVLVDSKGKFVWQSFDFPTDTILVGQSLRVESTSKLFSRASVSDNSNGPYRLAFMPRGFGLYYKSKNSPSPLLYFSSSEWFFVPEGRVINVSLYSAPETEHAFTYRLILLLGIANTSSQQGAHIVASPKFNSTYTYMRLGIDGSLTFHSFYDKAEWDAWEVTSAPFSKGSDVGECQLPERCGKFGLCDDNQCVGCPLPSGLMGWTKSCEPVKVTSCNPNDFQYYKIEGVDHFLSKYTNGDGPMKEDQCKKKCTLDCKCFGYFYHQDTSKCWIAYDLKTLTKVVDSAHSGYIKAPNPRVLSH